MTSPAPAALTRLQRWLIGIVITGAILVAGIGFAGSYTAVTKLAVDKGFGRFAYVFTIGLDAGIAVLLALDLLLTWVRIPFPLLRQTAWLLTAATIAFNAAAAWPDPVGVGMHAVIPILFVVVVEAARHAIGRIADITADKHMDSVRMSRWLLDPVGTFLLWRRMKLWELRSYEQVIKLEQERLIERARLRRRYGRRWRSKAPVEAVLALRLTRYGRPLAPVALEESALGALPAAAVEAPRPAPEGIVPPAVGAPPAPALERPRPVDESAPEAPRPDPTERPEPAPADAPEAPAADAPERPESTPPRKRKAPSKRPAKVTRTDAKDSLRALYDTLQKRPVEGELVEELKRIGYPHTSRQHANRLRSEIEEKEPHLAALGSDNVRALTGT